MGARGPQKKPKLAIAGAIQPSKEFDSSPPNKLGNSGTIAWKETVAALAELGTLHFADRSSLTAYCVAHDRRDYYEAVLLTEGECYEGPNGAKCIHPYVVRREKEELAIERFQKQYGMTAVSREGLSVGVKKAALAVHTRKRG